MLLDEAECRERAYSGWLDCGPAGSTDRALFFERTGGGEARTSDIDGPVFSFCGEWGTCEVSRESGLLVELVSSERALVVDPWDPVGRPRSRHEQEQQVCERARLSLEEAHERARAYAVRQHPGLSNRVFEEISRGISIVGEHAAYSFAWKEVPGEGQVAVFPNLVSVDVHPCSGRVTAYHGSDLVLFDPAPPPVTESRAVAVAAARHRGARDSAVASLTVLPGPDRRTGRTVWVVRLPVSGKTRGFRAVTVDAYSAELLA